MHSVILTVGLFALTFLSPGPNLFVVVQASLVAGRSAGFAAGLGVAVGDGIYAGLGLLGMATLIARSGELFSAVQVVGGLYLLWLAWKLVRRHPPARLDDLAPAPKRSLGGHFMRGLMTDLANPQTVLFFASIFALTQSGSTPSWARLLAWLGILGASLLWRSFLSVAFSRRRMRIAYGRWQRGIERIAGILLASFGARLLLDGICRR